LLGVQGSADDEKCLLVATDFMTLDPVELADFEATVKDVTHLDAAATSEQTLDCKFYLIVDI